MGIFSKVDAKIAALEADAKADASAAKSDVEAVAERAKEVVETLEAQALAEVEWFLGTVEDTLDKLKEYETKLQEDIASKGNALAKVQETIGKVQAVAPVPATGNPAVVAQPTTAQAA